MALVRPYTGEELAALQAALLKAVADQLQDTMDSASAAQTAVANAVLVPVAIAQNQAPPQGDGMYVHTLSVGIPSALLQGSGGAAVRRGRALQASKAAAALSNLLQTGFLMQRLSESGVVDANALLDSGALSVSAVLVAAPSASAAAVAAAPAPASSDAAGISELGVGALVGIALGATLCIIGLLLTICCCKTREGKVAPASCCRGFEQERVGGAIVGVLVESPGSPGSPRSP